MDPVAIAISIGIPAFAVLFYFEGLVVGKLVQPPVIFVGFVVATGPGPGTAVALGLVTVVAATVGQWTLYRAFDPDAPELVGVRRTVPYLESLPERVLARVGESRLSLVERGLERYGLLAICATNALPGIRGLIAIPAGLSGYPLGRFLAATTVGNLLYVLLLFGAASGVSGLARILGVT